MAGSNKKQTERESILNAMQSPPPAGYFVWDGIDEDDKPLSREEMQKGIDACRQKRGRPMGSVKTQIALRVDNDTLSAFRATGPGWQTRMNDALRAWLKEHATR